jgi:predicted transcriptional regulator
LTWKLPVKQKRSHPAEKENRDILIYLLWKRGGLSNQEIGALLCVTYSMVSKVVSTFGDRVQAESKVRDKIKNLNSQFKV